MSLWDILRGDPYVRQSDIEANTNQLKSAAHSDADHIHALEQRVSELALVSAALWELLKKNSNLSDEELKQAVAHLRTGGAALPGVAVQGDAYCPACNHRIGPTVSRCIYCGAAVTPQFVAQE